MKIIIEKAGDIPALALFLTEMNQTITYRFWGKKYNG